MQRARTRAVAAIALATLCSTSALAWAATLHAAIDHPHRDGAEHHGRTIRLDLALALHGHAHEDGTAPHDHPVLVSGATPLPGRAFLLIGATIGGVPEPAAIVLPRLGLPSAGGPTHDPPSPADAVSVLRV